MQGCENSIVLLGQSGDIEVNDRNLTTKWIFLNFKRNEPEVRKENRSHANSSPTFLGLSSHSPLFLVKFGSCGPCMPTARYGERALRNTRSKRKVTLVPICLD